MKNPKAVVSSEKVIINAPVSLVWQVLTDLQNYPQWNLFTVKVESDLTLGSAVDLYLPKPKRESKSEAKKDALMCQREYLKVFAPQENLAWGMVMKHRWILEAQRDQRLEIIDANSCSYVTTDSFKGLLTGTVMKNQGQWIKDGFDSVAFALKARAEALFEPQSAEAVVS